MIRKQITVCLPNRPGALAKAARAVAKAEVNVEAVTIVESTEIGIVRMLVSDPAAAVQALDQQGVQCMVEKVSVLALDNRPGRLSELALKMSQRGININYMYGSASGEGGDSVCRVVIGASDLEELEALWGQISEST